MDGQVTQQTSSYRQGLVLGLTMAEIILLLVFCLLIAMATFIHREQSLRQTVLTELQEEKKRRVVAEDHLRTRQSNQNTDYYFTDALQKNPSLAESWEKVRRSGDPNKIDEFWRVLVDADRIDQSFRKEGVTLADAREGQKLRAKGINAEKAIRGTEIASSIEKVHGAKEMSPVEVADAIDRGMRKSSSSGHQWPPIIDISEARGRNFQIGRAELSEDFKRVLEERIPQRILEIMKQYDVDVIEVVGHTDEQPLGKRPSNLDSDLLAVLKNSSDVASLVPADNAGLGLARAVSVVSVLRRNKTLRGYKIIPLSGAQLVNTDETLTTGIPGDIPERRRIEIRVRKSPQRESVGPTPRAQAIPPIPREQPQTQRPAAPTIFQWPWAHR